MRALDRLWRDDTPAEMLVVHLDACCCTTFLFFLPTPDIPKSPTTRSLPHSYAADKARIPYAGRVRHMSFRADDLRSATFA